MVTGKFFFRNEMYRGIVLVKIVGHCLYVMLDLCKVCTLFGNNKTFSCVLLPGGKGGIFTVSYGCDGFGNGNGVLLAVLYAFNTADRIGVTLAYALAPEGLILSFGKNAVAVKS